VGHFPPAHNAFEGFRLWLGSEAYHRGIGTIQAPYQGVSVADKSPRQIMSKKSGKSLKQKRADKRATTERSSSTTDVLYNQTH
jgi:hypothetical protein